MKRFYRKHLSEEEIRLLRFLQDNEWRLFFSKDIRDSGQFRHCSNLLINLKKQGFITELEKGKYVLASQPVDSFLIAGKLIKPSAIAYWSALNYYGMTEQIPNVILVQTLKKKQSKTVLNVYYQFITVKENKFFGFHKEWTGNDFFYITDLEKTIIDCFDMPKYAGGFNEAVKGLMLSNENLDKEKLWDYALRIGNNTVIKRIGYLSQTLKLTGFENFQRQAKEILSAKYTILDPLGTKQGKYVKEWRLLVNIDEKEIHKITQIS